MGDYFKNPHTHTQKKKIVSFLLIYLSYCCIAEPNLKLKMRIQLINAAGLDEAGIDGGGIFREFLSELLKTGFDPNRGFFKYTADRLLYPNPQASMLVPNFTQHFFFLGRMLGKVSLLSEVFTFFFKVCIIWKGEFIHLFLTKY